MQRKCRSNQRQSIKNAFLRNGESVYFLNMNKALSYYMELPYKAEIIKDTDENEYAAYIPELKGCITTGMTIEDALENLKDAKEAWLSSAIENGDSIPLPKS